ncbi:MAG TPA: DUF5777 family beta-barrel protein [Sunxiuqinia sp.]|nr:DUF5777 family beta-barrel protein [Sunxiuqinia sp.]
MKKNSLIILLFSLITTIAFAQDEAAEKDAPVYLPFESGSLIDAQTTEIPDVKTLEFVIQHKFGTIENGISDLWGLYSSANIRLGINYVPYKNIQLGVGLNKSHMTTDLNAKWTILEQTEKNTVPVAVALYGNVGIDGRPISGYSNDSVQVGYTGSVGEIKFPDRLSYFAQLIVSRKFNEHLSLQAGVSFSHYNIADLGYDHDKIGVHFNGRIKVTTQGSIIFNYDQPLKIKSISENREWTTKNDPKPNIAFGYEVSTGAHAFQIYMGTTNYILPQETMMMNASSFDNKGLSFGFVITRLWYH